MAQDDWGTWVAATLAASPEGRTFVCTVLGALLDYDERHHGDLVRTVEVMAACGWSPTRTARRLFLLRNSVLYRRGRIEEITGRSLDDPGDRLLLQLAAAVHRIHDSAGALEAPGTTDAPGGQRMTVPPRTA